MIAIVGSVDLTEFIDHLADDTVMRGKMRNNAEEASRFFQRIITDRFVDGYHLPESEQA